MITEERKNEIMNNMTPSEKAAMMADIKIPEQEKKETILNLTAADIAKWAKM